MILQPNNDLYMLFKKASICWWGLIVILIVLRGDNE